MKPEISVAFTSYNDGRMDTSIFIDFENPTDADMSLEDAQFTYEELGKAIARAKAMLSFSKEQDKKGGEA